MDEGENSNNNTTVVAVKKRHAPMPSFASLRNSILGNLFRKKKHANDVGKGRKMSVGGFRGIYLLEWL